MKPFYANLDTETIRQKDSSGATPLHRAAMMGRISEIPKYLLKTELFLVRDNGNQTPLHRAAFRSQLDKIPEEFLTKETMLASDKYETGRGRTDTPLEMAIRYGCANQIPKKFLTPEFLSMESRGGAILHFLATVGRLDVVPDIYADSPMWSLKNESGRTPRDIFDQANKNRSVLDTPGLSGRQKLALLNQQIEEEHLRLSSESPQRRRTPFGNLMFLESQRRRLIWDLARPIRLTLPIQRDIHSKLLPAFTDESLRAIEIKSSDWTETYIVNLLDYSCTCSKCLEIHSGAPPRDVGCICKHIIIALRDKNLVGQLPPIARGIVEHGYPEAFGIYPGRFANDIDGNPIYITGQNEKGWVSIFALKRRAGVNYYRFGYNLNEKRWWCDNERGMLSWRLPRLDESILC